MNYQNLLKPFVPGSYSVFYGASNESKKQDEQDGKNKSSFYLTIGDATKMMKLYDEKHNTSYLLTFEMLNLCQHTKEDEANFIKHFFLYNFAGFYCKNDNVTKEQMAKIAQYCHKRKIDIFESKDIVFAYKPYLYHLKDLFPYVMNDATKGAETKGADIRESSPAVKIVKTPFCTYEYLDYIKDDLKYFTFWEKTIVGLGIASLILSAFEWYLKS